MGGRRTKVRLPGTPLDGQHDPFLDQCQLGDRLLAEGDAERALTAYKAALVAAERLAAQEPTNTRWQRHHALSHGKVGDALRARGDAAAAVAAYRAALAIARRLAAEDPTNAEWRRRGSEAEDVLIVGPSFAGVHPMERQFGMRGLWKEAGGDGPLDIYCLTPEEFERAREGITLVREVLPEAIEV